jgi:hypothetical protein
MNAVVSNNARKFRTSRPDGVSLPKKGNHFQTNTGDRLFRDTKASFPQIDPRTDEVRPYKVAPYVVIDGIFFDDLSVKRPPARKAAKPKVAKTTKRRRQDPGPGTRPSLKSIRKG